MRLLIACLNICLFFSCTHVEDDGFRFSGVRNRNDIKSWVEYSSWVAEADKKDVQGHISKLRRIIHSNPNDESRLRLAVSLIWKGNGETDLRKAIFLLKGVKDRQALPPSVLEYVDLNLKQSLTLSRVHKKYSRELKSEAAARKKLEDKIKAVTSIEKTMEQRANQAKVRKPPM